MIGSRRAFSTSSAARLLGVTPQSVANWIDQGRIEAVRTPGGHRRIAAAQLARFMREQGMPLPRDVLRDEPSVLIVDDEPAVTLWVGAAIVERYPRCEVLKAHDGFTAGELVATARPDVVILDILLPGIDGYEVCRRIKAREAAGESREIAVIAITGQDLFGVQERILRCGAQACLAKPLAIEELLREVAVALDAGMVEQTRGLTQAAGMSPPQPLVR